MRKTLLAASIAVGLGVTAPLASAEGYLNFEPLWTTATTGAEIGAYDTVNHKVFVTNPEDDTLDVMDAASGELIAQIELHGSPNSVSFCGKQCAFPVVAVAVEGENKQDPGCINFYRADTHEFLGAVETGALPDMVTFTPDGTKVVVANEGEPNDDYTVDPEGSISIIDISGYAEGGDAAVVVNHLSFAEFNSRHFDLALSGVRIYGPNATVGQDIEPEYITVSEDSSTAWVSLQENNAIAEVDLLEQKITAIRPLGFKRYARAKNVIDASNEDGINGNFQSWPVLGMYQPDAIASYSVRGHNFIVTTNEGDARDYDGFSEEARVKDLVLDPMKYPDAEILQADENLGRLKTTTVQGDYDSDGDVDQIFAYGGRSFSIWDEYGVQVFDSGNDLAKLILNKFPDSWDDGRSDDKGSEPEAVVLGKVRGRQIAFIGLERYSVVLAFDVSNPFCVRYVGGVQAEGDVSPEGLIFVNGSDSFNGNHLLGVVNEVSTTTTFYEIGNALSMAKAHKQHACYK